ncbi:MAG: glycosyltransferase family 4 protein [Candidatus Methylumidiphilus sp.]
MDILLEQLAAAKADPEASQRQCVPSRIAYAVSHSLPFANNGYAVRTHGVATALVARGLQVYAFTRPGLPWSLPGFADEGFGHHHAIDGVQYIHRRDPWVGSAPPTEEELIRVHTGAYAEWFRVFKPSAVVAASGFETALPALIAARRMGLPFVYEVRGFAEIAKLSQDPSWQDSPEFQRQLRIESAIAQAADAVTALGQPMLEELVRRGVGKDSISIMPDAVRALPEIRPRDPSVVAKLGIEGNFVVAYIGSLSAHEGLDDLIAACGQLRRQEQLPVKLLIVGSSNPYGIIGQQTPPCGFTKSLRETAEQHGFAEHITFTGRVGVNEVGAYYALADAIVLPRKPDPVSELVPSIKLIEALAYGKPVLASSVAPLKEEAGAAGGVEYFDKGNASSLRGELSALLRGAAAAATRAAEARQWVGKNRLWADSVNPLVDTFHRLTGQAVTTRAVGAETAAGGSSPEIAAPVRPQMLSASPPEVAAPVSPQVLAASPPQAATPVRPKDGSFERRFFLDVGTASDNLKLVSSITESVIETGGNLGHVGSLFGRLNSHGKQYTEVLVNGIAKGFDLLRMLEKKQVILIAGHDLRFVQPFVEYFSKYFTVIVDKWLSTNKHDPKQSSELLQKADIIWCEWCCENAIWYSKHRKPTQKLFVRLHKFEIETKYPSGVDWGRVDALIFIAEGMRVYANAMHKINCRQLLLYNAFDVDAVERAGASVRRDIKSLAVMGYVPKIKRLDRAIDVFSRLYQSDPRFSLHIKGKSAREMDWIWKKESQFFIEQKMRLDVLSDKGAAVTAQPYDDKVHEWLGSKGFLLSASDIEGSHQAVAEAMAVGTVPVIYGDWVDRFGARLLYPSELCFSSFDDAVEFIRKLSDDESEYQKVSDRIKYFAHQNFNRELVLHGALSIFSGNAEKFEYVSIPQAKRILVFTDLCPNVIDGSAVWLLSTIEMLLQDSNLDVVLISRESVQSPDLLRAFVNTNRFYLETFSASSFNEQSHIDYLRFLAEAADRHQAHKIIVRAAPTLINKAIGVVPNAILSKMIYYVIGEAYPEQRFLESVSAFFVQTDESLRRLTEKFGNIVASKKVGILRPMIPDTYSADIVIPTKHLSVIYMGKLSKEYMAAEMVDFIRKAPEAVNFLVLAAKYQRSDGEDYVKKLRSGLNAAQSSGKALVMNSLSRLDVMRLAKGAHIGWSLRGKVYAESSEISTKVLEYCSLGKPVILNDFSSNKTLLGDAYPLYANSVNEAAAHINLLLRDAELYRKTAEHCAAVAQRHKMSRILNDVIDIITH